jgi:hypothetical protein
MLKASVASPLSLEHVFYDFENRPTVGQVHLRADRWSLHHGRIWD